GVAVETIKGGPIESRAQPDGGLMSGEVMEAAVRILGQAQPGEQACRFLASARMPIIIATRLEIHLRISRVDEWKLARQPFAGEEPDNLAGFIGLGQCQARQFQASRRLDQRNFSMQLTPAAPQRFRLVSIAPR